MNGRRRSAGTARWLLRALALVPLLAGAAESGPEEATSLLFLGQDERRVAFGALETLAPVRWVRASEDPWPLVDAPGTLPPVTYTVDGETFALDDLLAHDSLVGLVVVQGDRVRFEHYADGHDADSRWVSFSVTKSVTSMLIGAAIRDGYIESVDEPVAHYLPRLRGTAYEDVTLEQVLHMASGVAWDEDYADPDSDVSRAGGSNGLELVRYLADLPRAHPPGETFNYNTGETNLGGEVLRAALGNNAATYLEHRIWQPFGMADDATWLLGGAGGGETGGCCISATLRDYARIGIFAKRGGRLADGTPVLAEDWMARSITPSPGAGYYGYQWWLGDDGAFSAQGIFGQRIVVDPDLDLVIAAHGNAPAAVDTDFHAHLRAAIEGIRAALR
jgi:CubicO group peptidase (beta-lactamase class C family)